MTREKFRELFFQAINVAITNTEMRLGRPLPAEYKVELHAPGFPGQTVSLETAVEAIFLSNDVFYRIIDVAVKRVSDLDSLLFVRVSGHPPAGWTMTWDPKDLGPFKQIEGV